MIKMTDTLGIGLEEIFSFFTYSLLQQFAFVIFKILFFYCFAFLKPFNKGEFLFLPVCVILGNLRMHGIGSHASCHFQVTAPLKILILFVISTISGYKRLIGHMKMFLYLNCLFLLRNSILIFINLYFLLLMLENLLLYVSVSHLINQSHRS